LLDKYWKTFPSLKDELFEDINSEYVNLKTDDIKETITNNQEVRKYLSEFNQAFQDFDAFMKSRLIDHMMTLSIPKEESLLSEEIFNRMKPFTMLDKYKAYQALEDEWKHTEIDLEIIQSEGFDAVRVVDPNMVIKKKDNKEEEVQDGWVGRIIPFQLVQNLFLKEALDSIEFKEQKLLAISSQIQDMIDSLQEEDKELVLNDDNTAFDAKKVKSVIKDLEDEGEDSLKSKLVLYNTLSNDEKQLKKDIKIESSDLIEATKKRIEHLKDEEANMLLEKKWIHPIMEAINALPQEIIIFLTNRIKSLKDKYDTTFSEVNEEIIHTQKTLTSMLDELKSDEFTNKALIELKSLLEGE
jgi:type I restriction enzyme M protein